jgi:polyribonucleotide nucleotidyltransferase
LVIHELMSKVSVSKEYEPAVLPEELQKLVTDRCGQRLRAAKAIRAKTERDQAVDALRKELLAELCPENVDGRPVIMTYTPAQVREAFQQLERAIQREMILSGSRPDGRAADEVRPLGIDVGVLPRTHGSALFNRGETQALVTTTLGTPRDKQIIDGLQEEYTKNFMLHYNFPPFSVGEIRPIRGPGRREIGHGALAEKSLEAVMPPVEQFPYTVRVVADILESNGSTSMATVCGGCLSLMDAGVPIKAPVAGISIGMVAEDNRCVLLTDITGEEDFHGDMDFKVAGTAAGITGIQVDLKARGISHDLIVQALEKAHLARMHVLGEMTKVLAAPRGEINQFAPRMFTLKINPEKIGKLIGPGGKTINKIQLDTGATIDIEDDGTVYVACVDAAGAESAKAQVEALTAEVEIGKIYTGTVVSIRDFGAFIEIMPGQDGLCHVSELDEKYVKNVTDVVKVGDTVSAKVISIDDQGRVKLSRKAALREKRGTQ